MSKSQANRKHPVEADPQVARNKANPKSSVIRPDLTPMIDVTFQLLIFFLVTASFIPDEGQIPGSLPKGGPGEPEVVKSLHLHVTEGGDVTNRTAMYTVLNRTTTDPQELFHQLQRRRVSDQQALVIDVEPQCKWKYVVEAFNQGTRADFRKIGFKQ